MSKPSRWQLEDIQERIAAYLEDLQRRCELFGLDLPLHTVILRNPTHEGYYVITTNEQPGDFQAFVRRAVPAEQEGTRHVAQP